MILGHKGTLATPFGGGQHRTSTVVPTHGPSHLLRVVRRREYLSRWGTGGERREMHRFTPSWFYIGLFVQRPYLQNYDWNELIADATE